ncbi:MAG: DoxX family protein [Acidobacteriota bacterium]|nr:DoxX family protein [Acidobacteriota bacterium]
MERFLGKYSPYIYALLRIIAGFLLVWHGSQKLLGYPAPKAPRALDAMMGVAGAIELVGGLMIMLGLFASVAAFLASGFLAVAYFMAHAPRGFLPLVNGGELAVLYCFVFLYIAARGSGALSIDSLIRGNRAQTYNGA